MTLDYELYIEEHDMYVNLECSLICENSGIGSYEYWGSCEYDAGEDYVDIEDITWDKEQFSEDENKIIEKYVKDNWSKISEDALKNFDPDDYL